MNGDMAVRSITASISLWMALSAPRTICSVTGSTAAVAGFARSCVRCIARSPLHCCRLPVTGPDFAARYSARACSASAAYARLRSAWQVSEGWHVGRRASSQAVSAANAKAHIEHITTQIPSRLAGSANGKRMAEYSAAALTKAGVDARRCTRCRGW